MRRMAMNAVTDINTMFRCLIGIRLVAQKNAGRAREAIRMDGVRAVNRFAFMLSVLITGAIAGAFVWLVLFAMDAGLDIVWERLASWFGRFYPIPVCIVGGIVIGLFARRYGDYPEDLRAVMAKVKRDGRYGYDKIGRMSVAAVLPLVFGGSVGPEAGLTGVIAGLCSWAADRMRRFGSDLRELTEAGVTATMSALFGAPLYGFAEGMSGRPSEAHEMSKWMRAAVYIVAIVGALGALVLLNRIVGGGMPLPHYEWDSVEAEELLWFVPMMLVGALAGWMFRVLDSSMHRLSGRMGRRPVLKPVIAGTVLGIIGVILPFTMFSGEAQAEELDAVWTGTGALVLLATGFVKIAVTAMCVNMGWRGGHFFPVIFAGISIGYGTSLLTGTDPVFCLCVVTAALVGGVMRKPVMALLLLFLCFPLLAAIPMLVAAFVGSRIPLPGWASDHDGETDSS